MKDLSSATKKDLRHHDLGDAQFLFGADSCGKAHKALLGSAQFTIAAQASKRGGGSASTFMSGRRTFPSPKPKPAPKPSSFTPRDKKGGKSPHSFQSKRKGGGEAVRNRLFTLTLTVHRL